MDNINLEAPTIYNYDRHTFAFLSTGKADPDPLDPDNWLIPAFATLTPVIPCPDTHHPVYDVNTGSWAAVLKEAVGAQPETPVPDLAAQILILQKQIDSDVDDVTYRTIGMRAQEYLRADQQAREFEAAGFEGEVPISVASASEAFGITPRQAAEDIIQQATLWYQAQDAMRFTRLKAKHQVSLADQSQLPIIKHEWDQFVAEIRMSLGV